VLADNAKVKRGFITMTYWFMRMKHGWGGKDFAELPLASEKPFVEKEDK
jgi:hypothetical protein